MNSWGIPGDVKGLQGIPRFLVSGGCGSLSDLNLEHGKEKSKILQVD